MAHALIVGAGLAGLVAANELAERGHRVTVVDQEGRQSLGGQAFWSLGGLFMIDTPEQRRMGVRDGRDLAAGDWAGAAAFDRAEDAWPRRWAEAYLDFAAGAMRPWLRQLGMRWFPVVGWAERGGSFADGHGNSVPRFHITWGTGPGVMAPFETRCLEHERQGRITFRFRHRVDTLEVANGRILGASGQRLADSQVERGEASNRDVVDDFRMEADAVVIAAGGMGGNHEMVRDHWPRERLGEPPQRMLSGVPDHVDGSMLVAGATAGAALVNMDRMWHYTEGVTNHAPIWPAHGIRILPGPSSLWFDADGERLPAPCMPGFDTLSTLREICRRGHDHSWFVLTQRIIEKEFALSGSEQNPDFTSGKWGSVLKARLGKGATDAVEAFKERGEDFIVAKSFDDLVAGMNQRGGNRIDAARLHEQIAARDAQMHNPFSKDAQVMAIHAARNYRGDRLIRTARPHRILDPENGPLIAVKLNILTRKSLGGLHTDLDARALDSAGEPIVGLHAIGEAAGFGGGGYHGYNALEGTFLGGCIHSGRRAGRALFA